MKPSGILIRSALIAALGGLLFGFDTAVISGTTGWLKSGMVGEIVEKMGPFLPSISKEGPLEFMLGFTVASALIGTILGSILVGKPADALGRRGILFALAVLYFASAVGCSLAWGWWSFVFFRFVGGLAVGGTSVVSPMYIAEISPARYRGRLVAFTQFNIVLGILLAYFSNYVIGRLDLGENECRWMFGVMAAPSALFFLLLFLTPQSPRWLVAKARVEEARRVLEICGTDTGNLEEEIEVSSARSAWSITRSKSRSFEEISQADHAGRGDRHVQSAFRHQRGDLLHGGHFQDGGLRLCRRAAAIGDRRVHESGRYHGGHDGDRPFRTPEADARRLVGYIVSLVPAAYSFYTGTGGALLLGSLIVFIACARVSARAR